MDGALVIRTLPIICRFLIELDAFDVINDLGRLVLRDRTVLVAHDRSVPLIVVSAAVLLLLYMDARVTQPVVVLLSHVRIIHRYFLIRCRSHLPGLN